MIYAGARVAVGFHHYGTITTRFALSMLAAARYEGTKMGAVIERGGPYVDEARNQITAEFMKLPFEYLLMVDADIEFPEDSITKSIFVAETMQADVVWGNYSLGHFGNSIFVQDDGTKLMRPIGQLAPLSIYNDIAGGGTGWLLTRKRVLQKMAEVYPGPWHWFDRERIVDREGKPSILGEDLTFGIRAKEQGFKQVGYTGLPLIHHKLKGTVPDFMQAFCKSLGFDCITAENPYSKDLESKETSNAVASSSGSSSEGLGLAHGSEGCAESPRLGEERPAGREESGPLGCGEGFGSHLPQSGESSQAGNLES